MGRLHAGAAAAFTALGILGLTLINLLVSPQTLWFYHGAFVALWWPLTLALIPRRPVGYALAGSALTVFYLAATNMLTSPGHPWFLYACFPVIWWPIALLLGRRAGTLWFAVLCACVTISYYGALNLLISPGYPWAVYPAFAVVWWPMSMFFARRKRWFAYSVAAFLWIAAFFITVNAVSSPGVVWAVYPVFAVAWWPLAMYFFHHLAQKRRA